MRTKSKIMALLLATLMLLGLVTGCGDKKDKDPNTDTQGTEQTDAQKPDDKEDESEEKDDEPGEIVEISMSVLDRGWIPAELGTYTDNDAVDYINSEMNKLGVNVSVMPVPRSESRAKLNAMIAAGTAPDIIWEFSRPWMDQLRIQKTILPIEDIVEKYSTDYKAYYEEHKDLMEPYLRMEDGNIYAFSSLRAANALPTAGVWYREDLIESVDGKVPETFEELIDVSKKIVEQDKEIVPIAASYLHYLNIVKGTYGLGSMEVLDGDEIVHAIFSENYKDAMEMARRLFQEKITDQEYMTDTTSARMEQLWTSGKSIFRFDGVNAPSGTKELVQADSNAKPAPLPPLKSEYGQFMLTPQSATRFYVMLNAEMANDDKKQEACIKYLDWTIREGWEIITSGREGEQYTLNEDGLKEKIEGAKAWPYGEFALLTQEKFVFGQSALSEPDENIKPILERSDMGIKEMLSYPISNVLPFDFSSEEYIEFNATFSPKLSELEARMVSDAGYSVEQGIQDAQKAFKDMGGEKVWQDKNEWYAANKDTLQNFSDGYDAYKEGLLNNSILD